MAYINDPERLEVAVKETLVNGWAFERGMITNPELELLRSATAKLICLPERSRGTKIHSRRIDVAGDVSRSLFRAHHQPIKDYGQEMQAIVKPALEQFDPKMFVGFRSNRAVINRFRGEPDDPAIMPYHHDIKAVGRFITVATLDEGQVAIEGKKIDVVPGDLMLLVGDGLHQIDDDYPPQPGHSARAENLRHSIALIETKRNF